MKWSDFSAKTVPNYFLEAKGAPVAVYGAGSVAADIIDLLRAEGLEVSFVLDAKSSKTELKGVPIRSPSDPLLNPEQRKSTWVFIGIFNPSVDIHPVRMHLVDLGWKHTVDFVDLHASAPLSLGDRYWLTDRKFYSQFGKEIQEAYGYWADAESRDLFEQTLRFRLTGDDSGLRSPDIQNQYFPPGLPELSQPLRLIDCGACVGDTIRQLSKRNYRTEAIALFEPDPKNFDALVREIKKHQSILGAVTAFPCGVSSRFEVLRFSSAQGAASAISADGDLSITCLAIDEVLPGFKPNFIKMDVEGAEIPALEGARKMITQSKPRLAISAYHRPQDIWEIPVLIRTWDLGYKFYLRQHLFRGFDLVLYAIPN